MVCSYHITGKLYSLNLNLDLPDSKSFYCSITMATVQYWFTGCGESGCKAPITLDVEARRSKARTDVQYSLGLLGGCSPQLSALLGPLEFQKKEAGGWLGLITCCRTRLLERASQCLMDGRHRPTMRHDPVQQGRIQVLKGVVMKVKFRAR